MGVQDEQGGNLWRGIIAIVLVGLALGAGHNAMQRAAGPRHGLAWIKREVKLMSLEGLAEAATNDSTTVDSSALAGAAPVVMDSTPHTVAARDTSHMKTTAKRGTPNTKDGKLNAKGGTPNTKGGKLNAKGGKPAPGVTTPPVTAATAAPAKPSAPAGAAAPAATAAPTTVVPTVPDTREPLEAHLASIRKLYDAGVATFVDARSPEEYAEGHISGAVSMPFDEVFKDPDKVKTLVTHGRSIVVTYCGGGECDLSRNLAFSLIDAGHKKVLVFLEGYPGWKDSGAPVITGTAVGTSP